MGMEKERKNDVFLKLAIIVNYQNNRTRTSFQLISISLFKILILTIIFRSVPKAF
jgi:hypothetical protein